jgi:exodeoxyribonuclease VII small subunit
MSDKPRKPKRDDLTYVQASSEIESILTEIESGEIDLDALTERVERAAELLALCRARLAATETKVRKVVENLQAAGAGDADQEAAAEPEA